MAGAAQQLKHLTLELGGNDAGIVLPDANIDEIAAKIFNMAFLNAGQTCAALKRLYVHESQYEALSQKLADIANAQVVGMVWHLLQHLDQYKTRCNITK